MDLEIKLMHYVANVIFRLIAEKGLYQEKKHWLGVIGYILKKAKISSELVDFY